MKKLTKTLLTATLILGLPLGAYAASEAVSTAQPTQAMATNCSMDGAGMMGGKHHGGRHDKMARMQNMTPEQIQVMKQFAEANQ